MLLSLIEAAERALASVGIDRLDAVADEEVDEAEA